MLPSHEAFSCRPHLGEPFEAYVARMTDAIEACQDQFSLPSQRVAALLAGASPEARRRLADELDEAAAARRYVSNRLWGEVRVAAVNGFGIDVVPAALLLPL